jgi:glucokinase
LEKYAAGLGLDITAREIYGEGHTAVDLFSKALQNDKRAADVLSDAVRMLGNALVSAVNLLSPDCLLFSGGLSEQQDLFIRPLTEYIVNHCYQTSAGELPYIGCAELGVDAPMIGAALFT